MRLVGPLSWALLCFKLMVCVWLKAVRNSCRAPVYWQAGVTEPELLSQDYRMFACLWRNVGITC